MLWSRWFCFTYRTARLFEITFVANEVIPLFEKQTGTFNSSTYDKSHISALSTTEQNSPQSKLGTELFGEAQLLISKIYQQNRYQCQHSDSDCHNCIPPFNYSIENLENWRYNVSQSVLMNPFLSNA